MFDATPYLAISGAVNRFVEMLRPGIKQLPIPEEIQGTVTQVLSVLLGILMVSLAPGLNLFVSVPAVTPILGVVLTGAVVGLGAEFIDAIIDLLYSWQKPASNETTISTPADSGSVVSATVKSTTAPVSTPQYP